MRQLGRSLVFTVLIVLLSCASAWAQATAAISGTARDQSGAVLPGVTVTATQQDTGIVRSTVSNDTGAYSLLNLPLGPYRLDAELAGFRKFAQTGIVLQVGSNPVINPVLALGNVAEQVQVTASVPVVDTKTVGVSTVVESQRIVELPLAARQVTQLVTLSGAAVQTQASPFFSVNTGVRIAVAGGIDSGVSYFLDGAPHINNLDGGNLHLPFPDALQEFRLTTGSQDAGANIRAAASVNAVTKSGTNTLHGDAFEFLRDARFNSPDPFSEKTDGLKRNQFGGTLGGPLVKDKVFFFAGVQGTITRQQLPQTSFVPTAAMRAGDFTAVASPACNNGQQLTLGAGFVNNRIDPTRFSPAALNIAARLPTPSDACGTIQWGFPSNHDEYQVPVRLDVQATRNQAFLFRYMLSTDRSPVPLSEAHGNILASSGPGGAGAGVDDNSHSLTGGHTWVISPTTVNSLRVFGNILNHGEPAPFLFSPQDIGMNVYTYLPGTIHFEVIGGFSLGGGGFVGGGYTHIRNAGVSDTVTLVKGAHQYNVGGHVLWTKSDSVQPAFGTGLWGFTGAISGNALADFLLGGLTFGRQATPDILQVTQPATLLFASDSWRLKTLTLNYGVVWNPYLPVTPYDGSAYTFDRAGFLAGTTSTVIPSAPPGFAYPGDPSFSGASGVARHLNEWDPRVGFAWDVQGDGRTAVRGGVGLAHDYPTQATYFNNAVVSPYGLTEGVGFGSSLDNPWANFPGGNPFPYTYNASKPALAYPPYTSFLPFPPDLTPTRQYSWNIGVQRQLTSRWSGAATYLGNRITHMQVSLEQNPGLNLGFGPCTLYDGFSGGPVSFPVCTVPFNVDQRRALNVNPSNPLIPNPARTALGFLTQYSDAGFQHYHGMLLSTRFEAASLWTLDANYTLSQCWGVPQALVVQNLGNSLLHTPYENADAEGGNLDLDAGPCAADRRHLVNLTSVFHTPEYSGALGALASNWTLSSVLQVRSGPPINIIAGSDVAMNGISDNVPTQRPNIVPGVDPYGDGSLTNYLNINAFSQPAPGTYGNLGYNALRAPGFWQWDQAFVRGFGLPNQHRIEVRVEAINLTNHANYAAPGPFGTYNIVPFNIPGLFSRIIQVAGTPRVWQFALKYTF